MGAYPSLMKYWLLVDSGGGAAIVIGCEPIEELITVMLLNLVKVVDLRNKTK